MKTFFSIISTETNSYSGEQIAVGLLFATPKKIYFEYAPAKLSFLKKLSVGEELYLLTENALKNIKKTVDKQNKEPDSFFGNIFSKEYFEYLNQYAAGAVAFSKPQMVEMTLNKAVFKAYFDKMIGVPPASPEKKGLGFNHQLKIIFKAVNAAEFADLDYKLKVGKFDGIITDSKVSLITKNGSVQALEAIDFGQTETTIVNHVYETEIIAKALKDFCKAKNLKMSKVKLAFQEPQEKEIKKLFNVIYKEKKNLFDFVDKTQVEDFLQHAKNSGTYSKFSELEV